MDWLNLPGLMMVVALLAPNLLYALKRHGSLRRRGQESRLWTALEQLGRFGCMALMCVHTGVWDFGYASEAWRIVWLSVGMTILCAYCLVWVFHFRRESRITALSLALLPTLLFLLSGLAWRNVPLMALSLLFGAAHTVVTMQNAPPQA